MAAQRMLRLSRGLKVFLISVTQEEDDQNLYRVVFSGDFEPNPFEPNTYDWGELQLVAVQEVYQALANPRLYDRHVMNAQFSQAPDGVSNKSVIRFVLLVKLTLKQSAVLPPPFRYPSH